MPVALLSTPLIAVHLLALSVWVGSIVAIAVVARASTRVLDDAARIKLFASVGRTYASVGPIALVVTFITGVITAGAPSGWSWWATTAVVVTLVLVVVAVVAMLQAHRMTGLRRALVAAPQDPDRARAVKAGRRLAGGLRGAISLLTLVAIVFEAGAVVRG